MDSKPNKWLIDYVNGNETTQEEVYQEIAHIDQEYPNDTKIIKWHIFKMTPRIALEQTDDVSVNTTEHDI